MGFINTYGVNWTSFTPSFFKFIDPKGVPGLQTEVLGGEAITDDCIDKLASKIKLVTVKCLIEFLIPVAWRRLDYSNAGC